MKVLFIGGTGIISSACVALGLEQGLEVSLLCRGMTDRPIPQGAELFRGSIRDPESVRRVLGDRCFDAVVDWVAFTPEHVERDIELFQGRVAQYVFISSASVYRTPPGRLPVSESAMTDNPVWAYSRQKIACEERLVQAYREAGFPVTIVRPSHTYDERTLPVHGGWTVIDRMRRGKPVVVHGDGSSLWVVTHHRDFAKGFVPLLGNAATVGETFHITSDELLTWNQIYTALGRAAGVEPKLVHVPSAMIAAVDSEWGDSLLGDKTHSMIFDNAKIRRFAPGYAATISFSRGAEELIRWHDADASRRTVDGVVDQANDRLVAAIDAAVAAVRSGS
ncbi:MAG: SDR family oxidoreductase [Polyangiaceae bacterium]|nr:SDR family oxidoreductase [Polyangiaceae bacterium]